MDSKKKDICWNGHQGFYMEITWLSLYGRFTLRPNFTITKTLECCAFSANLFHTSCWHHLHRIVVAGNIGISCYSARTCYFVQYKAYNIYKGFPIKDARFWKWKKMKKIFTLWRLRRKIKEFIDEYLRGRASFVGIPVVLKILECSPGTILIPGEHFQEMIFGE